MNKMVSVIMPNYNGEKFISDAISSVLNQTYSEYEVIVVDDGSTDNSINIIKKFVCDKVKLYRRGEYYPKGANACRNIGIQKSRGEYVVFLDSDDLLSECCLENRVKIMNANSNINFAVFNSKKFWEDKDKGVVFTRLSGFDPIRHFMCTDNLWQTSSVIWKKSFLLDIGGFNLNYQRLQDPEMMMRALLKTGNDYRLFADSEADTYYRRPPKLGKFKMSRSYYANLQFVNDFYNEDNINYIDGFNTSFMFYLVLKMHYQYAESDEDKKNFFSAVQKLIKYNSSLKNNIFLKIAKNDALFKFFRRGVFTFGLRAYFLVLEKKAKKEYNENEKKI